MKSSRTKASPSTSTATVQSQARNTATLPLPTTLRTSNTTASLLRTAVGRQLPASPAGRKSPLKGDLKSKRGLVDVGTKSMKKHFLSKSNDSLSGGSAVLKKVRSHVTATPQGRGIRHPVVASSISGSAISSRKDKPSTTVPLHPLNGDQSSSTTQEMRRSVSSNCLDAPSVRTDTSLRRLSIPDVNCLNVNCLNDSMLLSTSLSPSNLTPSQSGITLISSATQTEAETSLPPRRGGGVGGLGGSECGDREYLSLMEENSEMSKEISALCKVEGVAVGESGNSEGHMDTSDGGCVGRSIPSVNDWDAQSNNSLCSEPSLAGLQDRIQQMEETHHSTHEELQATLQELAELTDINMVYKKENEDLNHEKSLLQDALCAMTEKVHVYQTQADSLKKMLYRQVASDENSLPDEGLSGSSHSSQNEKTLVELMKCLQEEKEESQHQLDSVLEQNAKLSADIEDTHNKLQRLDQWCDQVESEKKEAEHLLGVAKDSLKRVELENVRFASLLESEKSKVSQLETVAKTTAKADLDDLLDQVRREKNRVEEELTNAHNRIRLLENDLEGARHAFKSTEEKRLSLEKTFFSSAQEFAHRIDCKEEECRTLEAEVARFKKEIEDLETQNEAKETEKMEILHRYENLRTEYTLEQREWTHFQNDLLTAVRVANEFRTECELKTKTVSEENQALKRKTEDLTGELERLKTRKAATPPKTVLSAGSGETELRPRIDPLPLLRSPAEREPILPRTARTTPNQVSVKSIIQNLESNGRQTGRALAAAGKLTGIRRRDDNIVRSESNSSLDSTDKLLDLERYMLDDEPSMPGDGLKPILTNKQRNSLTGGESNKGSLHESLGSLAKGKGSKRNALLKFCQEKTLGYSGIDITNFSSSWNDGLAFCALIHSYLPDRIPYKELDNKDKRRNFSLAFEAAKSVGVQPTLEINDLLSDDRPDWRAVMDYVISIYRHFEM